MIAQIVDDPYDGTMDDAAWDRAFISIAASVRASATLLLAVNQATGALLREENHRLGLSTLEEYRRYWTYEDCLRERSLAVGGQC